MIDRDTRVLGDDFKREGQRIPTALLLAGSHARAF